MAAPASTEEFLDLVRKSGVTDERRFTDYVSKNKASNALAPDASRMAGLLVRDGLLTQFQAEQILQGKWRRFTIGKYKVLERLGAGGMGSVYLCEHKLMRRRVAVKVLPTAKAADPSSLERFYREARAVAALDHPNIVHAYDIDQDEQLHFLVMEYVDGASFQDVIKKAGPMDITRACHYIRQAAIGLEHAHLAGLVHRDIKPGNILVDRTGVVKILDMGLARFFNDEDDILTKKFDENVLGTADYLAPEQAIDSHSVDIRADIYSLGATFYFMLTGRTPFGEGTVAQKLLWHQTRQPKPVSEYRKDTPPELVKIISKMMDKEPANRYQNPLDIVEALTPFTEDPIGPPPDEEMPTLSPAALGIMPPENLADTAVTLRPEIPPAPRALQSMGSSAVNKPASGSRPNHAVDTTSSSAANTTPLSPTPKQRPIPQPRTPTAEPPSATRKPNLPTPRSSPKVATEPPPEPAPSPTPPTQDEGAMWGNFATETDSGEASFAPEADFTPASKPVSSRKGIKTPSRPVAKSQKSIFLIGGGVVVLTVLIIGLSFLFVGPAAKIEPPARKPLEVTADASRGGTYRSIVEAIRKAKRGDIIQLNDDVHDESISLDFQRTLRVSSEITIQPAPGKQVVWTSGTKVNPDRPIITLRQATNLKIQGPGLILDGQLDPKQNVKYIAEINMTSPGVTFQNVTFRSFDDAAIKIMNAAGDAKRPIRFVDCEANSENAKSAVFFDANPNITPEKNEFIEFENFRFTGPKTGFLGRASQLGDAVKGVQLTELPPAPPPPPAKKK